MPCSYASLSPCARSVCALLSVRSSAGTAGGGGGAKGRAAFSRCFCARDVAGGLCFASLTLRYGPLLPLDLALPLAVSDRGSNRRHREPAPRPATVGGGGQPGPVLLWDPPPRRPSAPHPLTPPPPPRAARPRPLGQTTLSAHAGSPIIPDRVARATVPSLFLARCWPCPRACGALRAMTDGGASCLAGPGRRPCPAPPLSSRGLPCPPSPHFLPRFFPMSMWCHGPWPSHMAAGIQ